MGRGQEATRAAGDRSRTDQRRVDDARSVGSSTAPPTRWTATATSSGRRWPNCPGSGRILAEGSGDFVGIIKNLQIFVTALRDSNEQIVQFNDRLATLTSVLDGSKSDLDAALTDLSVASSEVQRFVAGTRNQTAEQLQRLGKVTQTLVDVKDGLRTGPARRTERVRQRLQHLRPGHRRATRRLLDPQPGQPHAVRLRHDRRHENTTAPETAKLCHDYLGPALRLLNLNYIPIPINSVPGQVGQPAQHRLRRPQARARRRGRGAQAAGEPAGGARRTRAWTATCRRLRHGPRPDGPVLGPRSPGATSHSPRCTPVRRCRRRRTFGSDRQCRRRRRQGRAGACLA